MPNSSYVLVLKTGEEIVESLTKYLVKNNITAGSISGIGAATDVVLNFYNMETKEYEEKSFPEELEILSLIGNISIKEGSPFAHLHIVLGTNDYACIGGHLKSAHVGPTCEIVIQELDVELKREVDETTGLYLLDMN
ncbi:MAG: DNA-binding protein [Candidatus Peribacteraceae bacterium]|jgi:hypothetical protein|nr:DNA-binding protein [Candidatus Peribacteraceae bacterium]MDP7454789.1 DNA-binding protein [Candidatus Peribacteraceae bacterium]|tara:strand:- start:2763 stop:3173 length:411 start_codon:yes stop_codon:yes gene_type:complete